MLERIPRLAVIALAGCLGLAGCSSIPLSKTARQEAAYARYVRKFSGNRVKQTRKFAKVKIPKGQLSQNMVNAGSNSPQSASSAPAATSGN